MEKMVKECCLQRWFSETNSWDDQAACAERFVWLCCYGIPLYVWSNTSFQSQIITPYKVISNSDAVIM
ncbi:hypothetical protein RHMOL_Rhmol08G0144600 [Rhododendron molle]|uniref:Uncharacterized protein n=1 Tax=Rhododendron molle TaxID=49168 RepID=A0ACC0MNM4_RHOML|nr:hypothetical protein RHMOL_Rhmol08G0144600 [Rhododendron molle]